MRRQHLNRRHCPPRGQPHRIRYRQRPRTSRCHPVGEATGLCRNERSLSMPNAGVGRSAIRFQPEPAGAA
jgi:hypothetical protein